MRWWVKWQKQNADAIEEMQTKHGTQILRTPPEILTEFFKAWDAIAQEEMAVNPFFKKVYEFAEGLCGQGGAGQALHVPALLVRRQLLLPADIALARGHGLERSTTGRGGAAAPSSFPGSPMGGR